MQVALRAGFALGVVRDPLSPQYGAVGTAHHIPVNNYILTLRVAAFFCRVWHGLGAVYAWSVFRDPLSQQYGASVTATNITFSITIFTLGVAAFFGGLWMGRSGPRIVALTAGILYGAGIFLASFAGSSLTLLYLT